MTSSRITIKDVARKAGVSIATVSRFLNNTLIKDKNRKKIEIAIKELNYEPFIYARRMAGGRLDTFGLIIPGYEGIFYSFYALEIIRDVASALNKKDIDLHLHISWNKDGFKTSLVDGVIMADIIGNEGQMNKLVKNGVPLVVINKKMENRGISYVSIDNFRGAYEAVEFLINHGHRQVAHLAGDLRVQCACERLEGYKAALEKNGIEAKEKYIKITNFSRKEARSKLEELFSSQAVPTAIFCCSDEVASEVLSFAEERRIDVPAQLSVIGFDDNPQCIYGNLMLTTVRQPLKAMAEKGVELLGDIIGGRKDPQGIVLDTEIVIRDTVTFV